MKTVAITLLLLQRGVQGKNQKQNITANVFEKSSPECKTQGAILSAKADPYLVVSGNEYSFLRKDALKLLLYLKAKALHVSVKVKL